MTGLDLAVFDVSSEPSADLGNFLLPLTTTEGEEELKSLESLFEL